MPVPLIPCRHIDDPTLTADVPVTALGHFPDWRPIEEQPGEVGPADSGRAPTPAPDLPVEPPEPATPPAGAPSGEEPAPPAEPAAAEPAGAPGDQSPEATKTTRPRRRTAATDHQE